MGMHTLVDFVGSTFRSANKIRGAAALKSQSSFQRTLNTVVNIIKTKSVSHSPVKKKKKRALWLLCHYVTLMRPVKDFQGMLLSKLEVDGFGRVLG